jgi:hypothetical protein
MLISPHIRISGLLAAIACSAKQLDILNPVTASFDQGHNMVNMEMVGSFGIGNWRLAYMALASLLVIEIPNLFSANFMLRSHFPGSPVTFGSSLPKTDAVRIQFSFLFRPLSAALANSIKIAFAILAGLFPYDLFWRRYRRNSFLHSSRTPTERFRRSAFFLMRFSPACSCGLPGSGCLFGRHLWQWIQPAVLLALSLLALSRTLLVKCGLFGMCGLPFCIGRQLLLLVGFVVSLLGRAVRFRDRHLSSASWRNAARALAVLSLPFSFDTRGTEQSVSAFPFLEYA